VATEASPPRFNFLLTRNQPTIAEKRQTTPDMAAMIATNQFDTFPPEDLKTVPVTK
jgi:hypothetical protein